MNVNPAPTPEDREGFAAFLLRLRGKGSVPKALVAAFEATPRRMFLAGQYHPSPGRTACCPSSAARRWRAPTCRQR